MHSLRKIMDSFPWLLILVLTIFFDPVYAGIYRVTRGDNAGIIIGILWFLTGGAFGIGWVIDIITVLFRGRITILA